MFSYNLIQIKNRRFKKKIYPNFILRVLNTRYKFIVLNIILHVLI